MAAQEGYSIVTQYESVEFVGGNRTQSVVVVGVVTNDHGVYFETRLPKADYSVANAKQNAAGFSNVYELLFTIPGVQAVEWTQEPNPAGNLDDHVIVYFTTPSGQSSGTVDVPYRRLTQDYVAAQVQAKRSELADAEG